MDRMYGCNSFLEASSDIDCASICGSGALCPRGDDECVYDLGGANFPMCFQSVHMAIQFIFGFSSPPIGPSSPPHEYKGTCANHFLRRCMNWTWKIVASMGDGGAVLGLVWWSGLRQRVYRAILTTCVRYPHAVVSVFVGCVLCVAITTLCYDPLRPLSFLFPLPSFIPYHH